jgi:hypothetical protein
LYPASWRKRYGDEFEALLEDTGSSRAVFWDTLLGAITMQMSIWSMGRTVGACGLAGLAIAAVLASRLPTVYSSDAVIRVQSLEPSSQSTGPLEEVIQEVLSQSSLARIITDSQLYEPERRNRPIEDILKQLRNHLRIQPLSRSAYGITFADKDRIKAQYVVRILISNFMEASFRIQKAAAARRAERWELLDPPS